MKEPHKHKPKLTDAERRQRFIETAKKVDASENLDDLDKALLQIVGRGKRVIGPPSQ